jgi:predicted transcriptional regulator
MTVESVAVKSASVTEMRPLAFVTGFHVVRALNDHYVEKIRRKVRDLGVKPYPLSVTPDGLLYGGRHRLEAFKAEGIAECLMHIQQPESLDREAIELNQASEDSLPMTFVDYAELVWARLDAGATQQAVADGIGWSRAQVSQYAMLKKLADDAWKVVATSLSGLQIATENDEVAENATTVASSFSERLLREILDLTAPQQLDLCQLLAKIRASIKVHLLRHRAPARQLNETASEKFAFALIDDFPESA